MTKFSIWFSVSSTLCGLQNLIIQKPIEFCHCFASDHFGMTPHIQRQTEMQMSKCWGANSSQMCQIDNWQNMIRPRTIVRLVGKPQNHRTLKDWKSRQQLTTGHFWNDQKLRFRFGSVTSKDTEGGPTTTLHKSNYVNTLTRRYLRVLSELPVFARVHFKFCLNVSLPHRRFYFICLILGASPCTNESKSLA